MNRITREDLCPGCYGHGCKQCGGTGVKGGKPPKYGNVKTTIDGIKFDSQAEANYYVYLMGLYKAGAVKEFVRQPSFTLLEGYTINGRKVLPLKYVADFDVRYSDGRRLIIDVKSVGTETADFRNKRKLFDYKTVKEGWPDLVLLAYDNRLGWIELDQLKQMEREAAKYGRAAEKAARKGQTKQGSKGKGARG